MNETSPPATPETIHRHPDTRDALHAAMLELVRSAKRNLVVVSPALDVSLWNGTAMGEALGHFLAHHKNNQARFVIEDSAHMLQTCTRLVELARRFSDMLLIRRVGENHTRLGKMFAVADHDGCLVQQEVGVLDATLDIAAPRLAGPLARQFEDYWKSAEYIPGLHVF